MTIKTSIHPLTQELLLWFNRHCRDLPWRDTTDPYKIWISEVILQQTRVVQGLPYYRRFIDRYPTVEHLAKASEQSVLRLWQGLGYYSRARNLHRCAQEVVHRYGGKFPGTYHQLKKLPGIGDYTASAVASFAFGEDQPVVDGNVFRVLARLLGIKSDITKAATRKEFKQISKTLMPSKQSDIYNQALMEFGALQCTPGKPNCHICIFQVDCYAYKNGQIDQLPVKRKRSYHRIRYFQYFPVRFENRLLMKKRTAKDIWQGLYDFLVYETPENGRLCLTETISSPLLNQEIALQEPSAEYQHQLTHQQIQARFTEVKAKTAADFNAWKTAYNLEVFSLEEVNNLPKPILIDNYLKAAIF